MSRWDALQPSSRRFSGGRQHRTLSHGSELPSFSDRKLGATSNNSWRRRSRHDASTSSDSVFNQGRIDHEWKEKVEKLCACLHQKENNRVHHVHRNDNGANSSSSGGSEEEALLFHDLSEMVFSSKKLLSPRAVGEAIVMLIDCSQRLHPEAMHADILRFVARLAKECKVELTIREARQCVKVLSPFSQHFLDNTTIDEFEYDINLARLECLVRVVAITVHQLPAEDTAQRLVQNIHVPIMNKYSEQYHNDKLRHIMELSMDGIRSLLRDANHASAMLAPLVLDVSCEDGERSMPNPIRGRLLNTLQYLLKVDEKSMDNAILRNACSTLTIVMDSIRRVEQTSSAASELDLVTMEWFLQTAMSPQSIDNEETDSRAALQLDALKLVVSVLKVFPDSSSSLSSLVLSQGGTFPNAGHNNDGTLRCRCRPTSPLLHLLHSSSLDNEGDLLSASVSATQELLQTMPLKLWLTGRSGAQQQQYLGQRVSRGLEQVARILNCRFLQSTRLNPNATGTLCDLVTTFMNNVIFCDDSLIESAIDLISTIGLQFVQALSSKPEHDAFEPLGQALVECMGGRLTPRGTRTEMSVPVRQWLFSRKSQAFRDGLYEGTRSADLILRLLCIKILSAAVRTEPSVIQHDSERFHRQLLCDIRRDQPEQVRLESLNLLESFLLGRKEFWDEDQVDPSAEWVVSFVSQVLPDTANDRSSSIRIATMHVYGALTGADWCLLFGESESGMAHVLAVLCHCVGNTSSANAAGESNAQVRSEACKAIGNACTQILSLVRKQGRSGPSFSKEDAKAVCREVLGKMMDSIKDSNASVRSMALFAVGNIAQLMRERPDDEILMQRSALAQLGPLVYDSLRDKNDKVIGNAIRTSGHLYLLIFRSCDIDERTLATIECGDRTSYQKLVKSLTDKVELALTEATGGSAFMRRSWKQRSLIRKHAWGACNSLSVLLECGGMVIHQDNVKFSQRAVQIMIQCLCNRDSINEKVAGAAVSALVSIPAPTWSHLSAGTEVGGVALSACLAEAYKVNYTRTRRGFGGKEHKDVLLLLEKLVTTATISDVCTMLKSDNVSKAMLEFLYEWMTSQRDKIEASAFESFALALQRRDLGGEVSLQQKFASRSLQRYRNQQESSLLCAEMENICILDAQNQHDLDDQGYDEL